MPRAVLSAQLDAPEKTVLVPQTFSSREEYIAIRSIPGQEPVIRWTVVKLQKSSDLANGQLRARPFVVGSLNYEEIEVECRPIDPVKLDKVVLSAPLPIYKELSETKESITLPPLVRQGEFIADIRARVRACEPADQGLVGPETAIVVVAEKLSEINNEVDISGDIIGDFGFTKDSSDELEVEVAPLRCPINPKSLRPVPEAHEDLENVGLLRIDQFSKLGLFSGDCAVVHTQNGARAIRVYAFPEPEPAWAGTKLCLPPIFIYNIGSPATVKLSAASPDAAAFPEAKDIVLSRIASPTSTNRANQQTFLSELRAHFTGKARIVKGGDIIAIPIDTRLAQAFQGLPADVTLPSGIPSKADEVVFFRVEGNIGQSVFNPAHTRMVQSGLSQAPAPPSSQGWLKYYGLTEPFSYPQSVGFKYYGEIEKLLRASLTPRGSTLGTTIMLTSSRRGAGKTTVLDSVSKSLGIHQMVVECYELVGDGDTKALGTLTARLERAAACSPCMVVLRHLDALAKRGDQDGRDGPITSDLIEILRNASTKPGVVLAATTIDADKLAESVRSLFKFEIDIPVPTEKERKEILAYLTAPDGPLLSQSIGLIDDASSIETLIDGFALRGDVSISSLAMQSAGLIPPDLVSIVEGARQAAYNSLKTDQVAAICQRGIIKISPKDVEVAVSAARDSYSDSIGAPKIPNVGWKDVGGLDTVKGEIMDTIDMPLKYPQLFASGLKKRSGILFYGPPGTGKTLLAKAIATSFSLNFFSVKGPELLNMYIGESEANVRRVFQKARDAKPCVVFFDELDSVAPKRGNQGDSGGVMDRIVSQLLAELDGMSAGADGVFVIGATNRPDLLDEALLRPGRFDKMLYLGVSDTHEKQQKILEALTRKFDLASDVDLTAVARACPFTYTGADFYAMSSDAMLNAMTRTAGDVDAKIAQYNAEHSDAPLSTRAWFQKVAKDEDTHVEVTAADFAKAQRELIPSVSADELAHYQQVRATFEGTSNGTAKANGTATNGSSEPNGSQVQS